MAELEDVFAELLAGVRATTGALAAVGSLRALDDDQLLNAQRTIGDARRAIDSSASMIAGEIHHRSRPELGYRGLAQRQGFRTPERLVQHTTGSTARDAAALVTVGTLIHDAEVATSHDGVGDRIEGREPWLLAVGRAVASGTLSVDAAQAIRTGLGRPGCDGDNAGGVSAGGVSAAQLEGAVLVLLAEAQRLHVDALLLRARQLRDELDVAGVAQREQKLRDERSIRR